MSSLLKNYISFWSRCKSFEVACKKCQTSRTSVKTGGSTISCPSSSKKSQPVEISTLKQTYIVDVNGKQLATKAEIMSIDVTLSNYSFNSGSNKSDLFCKMFPDSNIAENFSCGKTKFSYVVCFCLAPYFLRSYALLPF